MLQIIFPDVVFGAYRSHVDLLNSRNMFIVEKSSGGRERGNERNMTLIPCWQYDAKESLGVLSSMTFSTKCHLNIDKSLIPMVHRC